MLSPYFLSKFIVHNFKQILNQTERIRIPYELKFNQIPII